MDNNPQAFPSKYEETYLSKETNKYEISRGTCRGMTLHDYHANTAMGALITAFGVKGIQEQEDIDGLANISSRIADAMLEERKNNEKRT